MEIEELGGSQCLVSFIHLWFMQAEHSLQLARYLPRVSDPGPPPSHSSQDLTITSADEEPEEPPPGLAIGEVEGPTIAALGESPGATMDCMSLKHTRGEVGYLLPNL